MRTPMVVALGVLTALVVGLVARPVPDPLPTGATGDADLARLARDVLGADRPALAVAAVTTGDVRTATMGATPQSRFEIGSISKGLTGLLLADMVDRGEVTPGTRVGDLLPLQGPVSNVTLEQLATHRSGLPTQPSTLRQVLVGVWSVLTAGNPHRGPVRQLLREVERTDLDAEPATYSNAGFELLGAALAARAGTTYDQLLRERVLAPLGLNGATVPLRDDDLDPLDVVGQTRGGRTAEPWLGPAIAPAGGVRADVVDLARLAGALLTGKAPGAAALTPRAPFGEDRIGWAWLTTTSPGSGRDVVWHNGSTGGFTAFLGVDRDAGRAVVLLSAVGESPTRVTQAGFTLLDRLAGAR